MNSHLASPPHRALRHHSAGIFEAERIFGRAIVNHDGRSVPVRFIAEQHVREDCRRIPSVADWLRHIPVAPWMVNGVILPDTELVGADPDADTGVQRWQRARPHWACGTGFARLPCVLMRRWIGRIGFQPPDQSKERDQPALFPNPFLADHHD